MNNISLLNNIGYHKKCEKIVFKKNEKHKNENKTKRKRI